jgi:putative N6-adenine-specific DNA methylase
VEIFCAVAPGLEALAARELEQQGLGGARVVPGGLELEGDLVDAYRINLWSRVAGRVLVRLGSFRAAAFPELREHAEGLPWELFVSPSRPLAYRVTSRKSRLYHTDAVAERVHAAIQERVGASLSTTSAPAEDSESVVEAQLVLVRIERNVCTVSVDSSGEPLHRRGYRLATAKAPLRETLAAGVLHASGWDGRSPLVDPFCGSGTIVIEAALMARKIAPGISRPFAFESWPCHAPADWKRIVAHARDATMASAPAIVASDRDAGAVEAAIANAKRAGVAADVQVERKSLSALAPPGGTGWVVSNPPRGARVSSGHDLRDLHAKLGAVLRERCPGWHVTLLLEDVRLQSLLRLPFCPALMLDQGGRRVRLVHAVVPRG